MSHSMNANGKGKYMLMRLATRFCLMVFIALFLQPACSREGRDPELLLQQGNALFLKKEYKEAAAAYSKVLALKPDFIEALINRGYSHERLGLPDKAILDYSAVIALKPGDPYAYFLRGNTFHEQGGFVRAVEDYTKAIEAKPDYLEAYYNRADDYARLGNVVQAKKDYRKACSLGFKKACEQAKKIR